MAVYGLCVIAGGDSVRCRPSVATVWWNEDEREVCAVIRLSPAVGPRIHLLPAASSPGPAA